MKAVVNSMINPNPCGWRRIWLPKLWTGITPQWQPMSPSVSAEAVLWRIQRRRLDVRRHLHVPISMPVTLLAKAAAERTPATRTSSVKWRGRGSHSGGLVKTTRSMQQRRHSSTGYTPREWRGDVTLPGTRSGEGVPLPCRRRERASLAVPHGGPAATEMLEKYMYFVTTWSAFI
jgi:hypothetical protein